MRDYHLVVLANCEISSMVKKNRILGSRRHRRAAAEDRGCRAPALCRGRRRRRVRRAATSTTPKEPRRLRPPAGKESCKSLLGLSVEGKPSHLATRRCRRRNAAAAASTGRWEARGISSWLPRRRRGAAATAANTAYQRHKMNGALPDLISSP